MARFLLGMELVEPASAQEALAHVVMELAPGLPPAEIERVHAVVTESYCRLWESHEPIRLTRSVVVQDGLGKGRIEPFPRPLIPLCSPQGVHMACSNARFARNQRTCHGGEANGLKGVEQGVSRLR